MSVRNTEMDDDLTLRRNAANYVDDQLDTMRRTGHLKRIISREERQDMIEEVVRVTKELRQDYAD